MELRDFATTILFGTDVSAKLSAPVGGEAFTDLCPGVALIGPPAAPGRPSGLELRPRQAREDPRSRVPFPSARELEDSRQRGLVLHFFANHELLAMELMALALLRFPEAPAGFRQGLARTIVEEQKHLRLYMGRMQAFDVTFGAVPVNRFFWDCIAGMATPLDYVTAMSLTLEQANLDFSRHFRDLFARLGDDVTAALLDVVYREEIGHVKHGVVWFNRLRPGTGDDWREYQELLLKPLSPVRAKGLGYDSYDAEARRQAGLSDRFIAELAVFKHSKGRPPVVYWFNPGCEAEIAQPQASFVPPRPLQQVTQDLASLMQFLTKGDDVVWVPRRPSAEFLAALQACGLPIPQFIEDEKELLGRRITALEPWGQSPAALRRQAGLTVPVWRPKSFVADWRIFSKAWSAELMAELAPPALAPVVGRVFRDADAAAAYVTAQLAAAATPLVIKAAFGSSGRGMLRVKAPGLEEKQRRWLEGVLASQGEVVVEPWLDRILDLSVQVNVGNDKRPVLGVTRFLTDRRGQYVGHRLGRKFADLTPEVRRALHAGGLLRELEATAREVGRRLAAAGYVGPAGIDALVYRDGADGRVALKPIVEINPRFTMGRVALELERYIHHTIPAAWLHLSLKQVQELGYGDFPAFIAAAKSRYPVERQSDGSGLMIGGAVATNDPAAATLLQSVLLIGGAMAFVPMSPASPAPGSA